MLTASEGIVSLSKKRPRDNGGVTADTAAGSAGHNAGINPIHLNSKAVKVYADKFRSGAPFPHLQVLNILDNELLERSREVLLSSATVYHRKKNDLYDFEQTDTLQFSDEGPLAKLRNVLYGEKFRHWMESVTGIETTDVIDISAARYSRGSHLLCHDDDLSTRRIAFILYLVPECWAASNGGTLDLYSTSSYPHPAQGGGVCPVPSDVACRIVPAWNSIAFFEVNPVSFHSVAEVLDDEKGPRLSVSGWFHGPPLDRPSPPIPVQAAFAMPAGAALRRVNTGTFALHAEPLPDCSEDPLESWINKMYLSATARKAMIAQFAHDASLHLKHFLREEKFLQVMKSLGTQHWSTVGPAHITNHRIAASTSWRGSAEDSRKAELKLNPAQQLFSFLTGAPFAAFLAEIVGLRQPSGALCEVSAELRAFGTGDYTLVADPVFKADMNAKKASAKGLAALHKDNMRDKGSQGSVNYSCVDAVMCLVVGEEEDWDEAAGGYITYLTCDDELLTVPPCKNSLSLVATEEGVMSFVKYLTQDTPENRYDIAMRLRSAKHEKQ